VECLWRMEPFFDSLLDLKHERVFYKVSVPDLA
jgi:hypothetical protein